MSYLIAIDPGLGGCGAAVFDKLQGLCFATYVKNPSSEIRGSAGWCPLALKVGELSTYGTKIVIERPQVYQGAKQRGDPDDLMELMGLVGALSLGVPHCGCTLVRPHEWKGQVPKTVMRARIEGGLTLTERAVMAEAGRGSRGHNVWDAVGLGLHALRRL